MTPKKSDFIKDSIFLQNLNICFEKGGLDEIVYVIVVVVINWYKY